MLNLFHILSQKDIPQIANRAQKGLVAFEEGEGRLGMYVPCQLQSLWNHHLGNHHQYVKGVIKAMEDILQISTITEVE